MKYLIYIIIPILLLAIITIIICYICSFSYETIRYDVNNNIVKLNKKVNDSFKGKKIVFFSDLHLGRTMKEKELRSKLNYLMSLNADLYIFGGDLIGYKFSKYYDNNSIKEIFKPFSKNYKCIAIPGNHEYKHHNYMETLKSTGFKILVNESFSFDNINILGVQECIYHELSYNDNNNNDIILLHQGDFFDQISGNYLMLSGHSHGGQIKIPLLYKLYAPKYSKKYNRGLFTNNKKNLIVSKGLGCGIIKVRFLSKCDIIILDYKKE